MSTKRVISINTSSKIYHKHGCRYVKKMLPQNRLDISKKEIRRQGYHCCRYCNFYSSKKYDRQAVKNEKTKEYQPCELPVFCLGEAKRRI